MFLDFPDVASAEKALKLNGKKMLGRPLKVWSCRSLAARPPARPLARPARLPTCLSASLLACLPARQIVRYLC